MPEKVNIKSFNKEGKIIPILRGGKDYQGYTTDSVKQFVHAETIYPVNIKMKFNAFLLEIAL